MDRLALQTRRAALSLWVLLHTQCTSCRKSTAVGLACLKELQRRLQSFCSVVKSPEASVAPELAWQQHRSSVAAFQCQIWQHLLLVRPSEPAKYFTALVWHKSDRASLGSGLVLLHL